MKISIGMIVLNEQDYIYLNLLQHYPLVDQFVIVEGADPLYPTKSISKGGLSTDKTAELIEAFPDPDKKIKFIQHGWCKDSNGQAKCELRNRYMEIIQEGLLISLDADEFLLRRDFDRIVRRSIERQDLCARSIPFIHFWKSWNKIAVGGFFNEPHYRFWQVRSGDYYTDNHNFVARSGVYLQKISPVKTAGKISTNTSGYAVTDTPSCYHFGFAKPDQSMLEKQEYYKRRPTGRKRQDYYLKCRASWFDQNSSPKLLEWGGQLPEAFGELGYASSIN